VALRSLIMGIEAHPVRGEGYPESHQYLLSEEKKAIHSSKYSQIRIPIKTKTLIFKAVSTKLLMSNRFLRFNCF
jgi:hypothetical protein